jgi:hypothetical protein
MSIEGKETFELSSPEFIPASVSVEESLMLELLEDAEPSGDIPSVDISIPGLTVVVVAVVVDIILCLMKCWAKKLYLRSGNLKARFGRQKQQKEPGT